MGSRERIDRQKHDLRCNILKAGWDIVKKDGWQALSMRKIADAIEYTAPVIYGCFENKEALLMEFTIHGHLQLSDRLKKVKLEHQDPAMQLEAMWLEYWAFAFEEKEYYQLMFGVEMNCCELTKIFPVEKLPTVIISEVIQELVNKSNNPETDVCKKFYTFWSVIHGLISINIVNKGQSEQFNQEILKDAITGIIKTITG
jgi:AcrR family transcriptional regulator